MLFFYASKAFDSISQTVILKKPYDCGFRGPFYCLVKSFLTHRFQRVSDGGAKSNEIHLKAGILQSSVLCLLLYNIYVNDLSLDFTMRLLSMHRRHLTITSAP